MPTLLRVLIEATPKKVYVSALDWPGLARWGRDEASALEALLAAADRYAPVAAAAGLAFDADALEVVVEEQVEGDASTAFGVPAIIAAADREPSDATEAARLASLVEAAWLTFDRIAAAAPEALRKGPRGGGRDRSKVVGHVLDAEGAYASVLGLKHRPVDAASITAMRADLLAVLRRPSEGTPVAGGKWPARYAARRIAWHVLDHAWEIEDRAEPA
jgi:hypothetical protein